MKLMEANGVLRNVWKINNDDICGLGTMRSN
jgi:hypothetical protein